ncbi:hypothetical protein HanIR_Chr11g0535241 [Helianthus annuus]|nr:hypothetical protein HanIR_Chr11g0535241 [Helianthus annuus]
MLGVFGVQLDFSMGHFGDHLLEIGYRSSQLFCQFLKLLLLGIIQINGLIYFPTNSGFISGCMWLFSHMNTFCCSFFSVLSMFPLSSCKPMGLTRIVEATSTITGST